MIIGNTYNDGSVKWRVVNNSSPVLVGGGNPIGSIVPYASNGDLPEGYLICNGAAISRTEYSDLFDKIGTSFGTGDGSTTFNVPDLRDKFIEGSTSAGTNIAAGLPNIWGAFGSFRALSGADTINPTYNYQGAISGYHNYISQGSLANLNHYRFDYAQFNASTYNSIYGNSSTVQPPSVTMIYIIKALKIENEGVNIVTPYNSMDLITTSGTYTAPCDGWYKITLMGAGQGGSSGSFQSGSTIGDSGRGGQSGAINIIYKYMQKGEIASVNIGAGGAGGVTTKSGSSYLYGSAGNGGNTTVTIDGTTYIATGGGVQFIGLIPPVSGNAGTPNHYGSTGGGAGNGQNYSYKLDGGAGILGGGGAGGYGSTTTCTNGGQGGNGYVLFEYYNPNK
jgi:hypothetical protein